MFDTIPLSLPKNVKKLFNILLQLYPEQYRKKFGQEMYVLYEDMYKEELNSNGNIRFSFWVSQFSDFTKSVIEQHIDMIQKQGLKKYLQQNFHITRYNMVSGLLLLPVFLMTLIEIVSRIAQRDLTHYNRPLYIYFSHSPLYWKPVLITWVILFPLFAALISFIPLIKAISKKKVSVLSLAFVLIGFGFIALILLHDFMPCMFYGLTHLGLQQFGHIVSVCRNA